jgi:orotate phosphoribosyltransferase
MVSATPRLSSTILSYLKRDLLLREGHFEFRSGRHTSALLDRDRLLADPEIASRMGYTLAKAFFTDKIDTVATPSIWGASLAQWIAYFLEPRAKVVHATPHKSGGRHIAENLHAMIEGKRILVVDNLIVSGETLDAFTAMIEDLGGEIIQIATLWDLADRQIHDLDVFGLLDELYPALLPEDCPLCAGGDHAVEQIPY